MLAWWAPEYRLDVDLEQAVDGYVAAWNEADPVVRAELLAASVADDFEFAGPTGTFHGRDAVEGLIVALQSRLGGAVVVRLGPVEAGSFRWAIATADGSRLLEGVDEVEAGAGGPPNRGPLPPT